MVDVKRVFVTLLNPLKAVFVDFNTIFDQEPEDKDILMLAKIGIPVNVLILPAAILQEGRNAINDRVTEFPPFTQASSLTQEA